MKLIDANVIIYALGGPHDYRDPSARVMDLVRAGAIDAEVSSEVLQEIVNYFHRHDRTTYGIEVTRDLVGFCPGVLAVDKETALIAVETLERFPQIQARDAFHAATVIQHGLEGIISADRAFDSIRGLTRFDPKELAA